MVMSFLINFFIYFDNFFFLDLVYSVEVALDLNELEALTNHRRYIRDALEKSTAVWKATGMYEEM